MKYAWMKVALGLGLLVGSVSARAATVDLSTWTAESYSSVSGFSPGNWVVAGGGASVNQTVNGQPTIFLSDFTAQGTEVSGKIRVTTSSDDDYIGFVLGFNAGDSLNASANYLLVDWKQTSQDFNFGVPSTSPGGNAPAGLAVSRVFGIPDADEFWQHDNLGGTPVGSGLTELARGSTLGNTGWVDNVEYSFTFDFGPNNLQVFVDDALELNINGVFSDGSIGFYNFSQENVNYSAFTVDPGSFPTPDPTGSVPDTGSSIVLLSLGLFALLGMRRRMGK